MRIAIVILMLCLSVPVAAQVDFTPTQPSPEIVEVYETERHLVRLAEFLLRAHEDRCLSVWLRKLVGSEPAATVCVFDDLYFDRQFFYAVTAEWGAFPLVLALQRDGETIAMDVHANYDPAYIALPIDAGEYELLVAGWYSGDLGRSEIKAVRFEIESTEQTTSPESED